MFPSTVSRAPAHPTASANEWIRQQPAENLAESIEENMARYRNAGPAAIDQRLQELAAAWDSERTREANAANATLLGLTLRAAVDRRWRLFPAAVAGFLLQHAWQGWRLPLSVFRRLGIRTAYEIDYERYALNALCGDFNRFDPGESKSSPAAALAAAEKSLLRKLPA